MKIKQGRKTSRKFNVLVAVMILALKEIYVNRFFEIFAIYFFEVAFSRKISRFLTMNSYFMKSLV